MLARRLVALFILPIALAAAAALPAAPTAPAPSEDSLTTLVFADGREVQGTIIPPRETLRVVLMPDGRVGYQSSRSLRGETPAPTPIGSEIRFRLTDGSTVTYSTAAIQQIILPEMRSREQAETLVPEVRQSLFQGRLLEALEGCTRLHRMNPDDAEVRALVWQVERDAVNQAVAMLRGGRHLEALDHFDAIEVHLAETGRDLTPPPGLEVTDPQDVQLAARYHTGLNETLRAAADQFLEEARRSAPADRRLLQQAHDLNQRLLRRREISEAGLTPSDVFGALLSQIDIYGESGDAGRALREAQDLQQNLARYPGITAERRQGLDLRIRALTAAVAAQADNPPSDLARIMHGLTGEPPPPDIAQPAPPAGPAPGVPQPLPGVAPAPPPSIAPAPADVSPPPSAATGDTWPRLRRALTEGDFGTVWSEITSWAASHSEAVTLGALVLGALLLFWVIPHKILKAQARRGSVSASLWAPRVKRFGPLALVLMLLAPIKGGRKRREKPPEHLCPHCGGDLSLIELYKDFRFQSCPHCTEPITPIFDLADYVENLISQINRVRGGRSLGAEAMGNAVEREAMLKLVRATITLAARRRASDLHVDASGDGLHLRTRIDGILMPMDIEIPKAVERAFVSAIKVMADLDITERRVPQDGRLEIMVDGAPIDIRLNTSPTGLGEKISMRLLDARTVRVPIERMGFSAEAIPVFKQAIHSPHGLILVTGPTGSGKSTTLYVALNEINNGTRNIVTLEDPIEYIFRGLNQHQVNPAANFTFATGLRSIIRQDPDVIMVGEIRDRETADIAVDAATTGHLVLTTLHTIDAVGSYQRLAELGIDPRRFAPSLLLIVAQRLIRLNCEFCQEPYEPELPAMKTLEMDAHSGAMFVHGRGCDRCQKTGYHGRSGLYELLVMNEEIRTLMETRSPAAAIREAARRAGMRTLREEGVARVLQGMTTAEEVVRTIS